MREADVQVLATEVQAAWNTHDMRRFAACFAEDADFVNVGGMWWRGRDEIEERHAANHATRFRNSRIALELAEVREIAPTVSIAHLRWTLEGHEASGPERTLDTRHGVWTWTLVNRDGHLEIAAGHNTDSLQPRPQG